MENKIKVEIHIENEPIVTFSSFSLHQYFNEHHTFELRFNQDQIESPGALSLNNSKAFIGKSILIEFGLTAGKENQFAGIVTNVEISQAHGLMGDIIISGFSPTILIDRGPDLGSYLNKDLRSIINQATKDVPSNDLSMEVNPTRNGPIDYVIQYRESDFEFINRLSAQYHEWFFYNGVQLVFGKPDELKIVKLTYGQDLSQLRYSLKIAPLKYKKFAYSSNADELLTADGKGTVTGTPDLAHVIEASNSVYNKIYNQPLITRVDNKTEIEDFVKNEQESIISGLVHITGISDNPQIVVGSIVDVVMSVKKQQDFVAEDFGKFLVTEIAHYLDGVGHYRNTFQAIPASTERIPSRQVQNPQPDMQLANVVDTADPAGQGRIKVRFKWTCDCNDVTEWLRVITPDAGSSAQVGKNRGFVFIPEIGDQVVVGFEEGNIARPIVLGSVFHGKSGSGGGQSNNEKSLISKSGNKLQMNDDKGSINLSDKGTANLSFDGAGNAVTNAANSKTINVGGDKDSPPQSVIRADADGNIVLDAKTSITLKVGENLLSIDKEGLIKLNGKDIKQTVENNYDLDAKKVTQTAKGANFKINSDQNVIVSGGIEVKLK